MRDELSGNPLRGELGRTTRCIAAALGGGKRPQPEGQACCACYDCCVCCAAQATRPTCSPTACCPAGSKLAAATHPQLEQGTRWAGQRHAHCTAGMLHAASAAQEQVGSLRRGEEEASKRRGSRDDTETPGCAQIAAGHLPTAASQGGSTLPPTPAACSPILALEVLCDTAGGTLALQVVGHMCRSHAAAGIAGRAAQVHPMQGGLGARLAAAESIWVAQLIGARA